MAYSIGSRSFDDLKGDIVIPGPMFDVESRTGQDGVVVFSTGSRGRQFVLESIYAESSYVNAQTLANAYKADPSLTPRNIIRGTVDFTATSIRFAVIGVESSIEPAISWQGPRGVVTPAFIVRAKWTLIAVIV